MTNGGVEVGYELGGEIMIRLMIAGIVGGVIIFFWGAIAHTALPLGSMGMQVIPNEDAVMKSLKESIPQAGLYIFPGIDPSKPMSAEEQQAWEARIKAGPLGLMVVNPHGGAIMTPGNFLGEIVSDMLSALLGSFVLWHVAGSYFRRVIMCPIMGLFGWMSISVSYWNWYGFPLDFTIAAGIEEAVGWLLAGLALAAIIRPRATVTEMIDARPEATGSA